MDWPLIFVVAWNTAVGFLIGYHVALGRRKPSAADRIISEAVADIKQVEKFAGMQAISRTIIHDSNGDRWKMTMEREDA